MAPSLRQHKVLSKDSMCSTDLIEDDFHEIILTDTVFDSIRLRVHPSKQAQSNEYLKENGGDPDDNYWMEEHLCPDENIFVEHEIHPIRCHELLTQASMPLAARQIASNMSQQCSEKKSTKMTQIDIDSASKGPWTAQDCVTRAAKAYVAPPSDDSDVIVGPQVERRHKRQRSKSDVLPTAEPHHLWSQFHPVYHAIQPGDVLFVKGTGAFAGLAQIGSTGGFAGHTILVTGVPTLISRYSADAYKFHAIWPGDEVSEIWTIPTLESARGHTGLLQSELVFRVDTLTGDFIIFGDVTLGADGQLELGEIDDDVFEVWQSPSYIRRLLSPALVQEVVADMKRCKLDWSLSTCVRAVFRAAHIYDDEDRLQLFTDICECWNSPPICTSVVIIFWQKAFCKLRKSPMKEEAIVDIDYGDALDLILRWMPLKADRGLPGELLQTMQQCGWIRHQKMSDSPRLSVDYVDV